MAMTSPRGGPGPSPQSKRGKRAFGRRPGDATAVHPTCKYVLFFPSLLAAVLQFHGPDDRSSSHHSSAPSHTPREKQASEIQDSKIPKHSSDCPLTDEYPTDCAPSHIHAHTHTHTLTHPPHHLAHATKRKPPKSPLQSSCCRWGPGQQRRHPAPRSRPTAC